MAALLSVGARAGNGATAQGLSAFNESSSTNAAATSNLFPPVPERRTSPHPSPQTARSERTAIFPRIIGVN